MGGWMSYQRMRNRNGLAWRPDLVVDNPYPMPHLPDSTRHLITGDMNRMERDYLSPVYPQPPLATRSASDPATECADALNIEVAVVRAVLRYVFLEQR